jgi:hypothetical protein
MSNDGSITGFDGGSKSTLTTRTAHPRNASTTPPNGIASAKEERFSGPDISRDNYKVEIDQACIHKVTVKSEDTRALIIDCLKRIKAASKLVEFWKSLIAQNV